MIRRWLKRHRCFHHDINTGESCGRDTGGGGTRWSGQGRSARLAGLSATDRLRRGRVRREAAGDALGGAPWLSSRQPSSRANSATCTTA